VKLLRPGAKLPWRATEHASGYDLFACLGPGNHIDLDRDVQLVPTGIALDIPSGLDVQVRPRSGLSRRGAAVIFGTIDADYRGEILVSMHTFGSRDTFRIEDGDRIAQLVIGRIAAVAIQEIDTLSPSQRGEGGHGSTGR
jgi:dUTP pyrophosphatase